MISQKINFPSYLSCWADVSLHKHIFCALQSAPMQQRILYYINTEGHDMTTFINQQRGRICSLDSPNQLWSGVGSLNWLGNLGSCTWSRNSGWWYLPPERAQRQNTTFTLQAIMLMLDLLFDRFWFSWLTLDFRVKRTHENYSKSEK